MNFQLVYPFELRFNPRGHQVLYIGIPDHILRVYRHPDYDAGKSGKITARFEFSLLGFGFAVGGVYVP